MKKNNIVLIGFMGVGKGTVARAIFKEFGKISIDTDDIIESNTKQKIKDIFEEFGEEYFRDLEKQCAIWLEKNITNTIISTGGGFYKQENLNKIGKIVYLKSSFEAILHKIYSSKDFKKKLSKRPLLQDTIQAKKLFNYRIEQYENKADIIIDVENKTATNIAKEIFTNIQGK